MFASGSSRAESGRTRATPQLPVLSCSINDVRPIANVLRGLAFCKRATVFISRAGLSFAVEDLRSMVVKAYLPAALFSSWSLQLPSSNPLKGYPSSADQGSYNEDDDEPVYFEISLSKFLACLDINGNSGGSMTQTTANSLKDGDEEVTRGNKASSASDASALKSSTALRLSYQGTGHPLVLYLTSSEQTKGHFRRATGEAPPITSAELTTLQSDENQLDIPFASNTVKLHAIMKSETLYDVLMEIHPSSSVISFRAYPQDATNAKTAPVLRIESSGNLSSSQTMTFTHDKGIFDKFFAARVLQAKYRMAHVLNTKLALQSSTKVSLRIDENLVLSIQMVMPNVNGDNGRDHGFVEYLIMPLDEDFDSLGEED